MVPNVLKICTSCGHSGQGSKRAAGNFALELLLWGWGILLFLVMGEFKLVGAIRYNNNIAIAVQLFPWLILAVAFSYTVWRHNAARVVCSYCHRDSLIEYDSPIGHKLREYIAAQKPPAHSKAPDNTKFHTEADNSPSENKQPDNNKQPESTMDFVRKNLNRDLPDQ